MSIYPNKPNLQQLNLSLSYPLSPKAQDPRPQILWVFLGIPVYLWVSLGISGYLLVSLGISGLGLGPTFALPNLPYPTFLAFLCRNQPTLMSIIKGDTIYL